MSAEERVLKSVQDAQLVLGEYIAPRDRDPEMTINRLLTILDDEDLVNAVWELDPKSNPMKNDCTKCLGIGWVCENHPDRAWSDELGCQCGAGMPCECNRAEEPDVSQVIGEPPTRH
jgi:hypothetical protein